MKSNKIIFSLVFLLLSINSFAQTKAGDTPPLTFKGKITFERKNNVHKQMDEMGKGRGGSSNFAEQMKKQIPKYKTDIFELLFNSDVSVYKLAKDGLSETKSMMTSLPSEKNIVYKDFTTNKAVSEKFIFEKTYLVQDSIKQYNWKITEEFRKIAGYNCRRAETIIMDSVYVIAFYTDAIILPSGPESFSGLPGMILGIVMPRLNLTYFATKVDQYLPTEKELAIPTKGSKTTYAKLNEDLNQSMKQWGDFLQRILWYTSI